MAQDVEGYKDQAGQEIPEKTGIVSEEDIERAQGEKVGGQYEPEISGGADHSTENYEESEPSGGVGAVQDYSDTSSDIAHIED